MIMCKKFNTEHYIQLQPTDYPAHRYIAHMEKSNQKKIELPDNLQLSPKASDAIEYVVEKINTILEDSESSSSTIEET